MSRDLNGVDDCNGVFEIACMGCLPPTQVHDTHQLVLRGIADSHGLGEIPRDSKHGLFGFLFKYFLGVRFGFR